MPTYLNPELDGENFPATSCFPIKFWYVTLSYATFGVMTSGGTVEETAPIARWMIGKRWTDCKAWIDGKGGKWEEIADQCTEKAASQDSRPDLGHGEGVDHRAD